MSMLKATGEVARIIGNIIGIFILLFFIGSCFYMLQVSDEQYIKSWAKEHDYQVVSIDRTLFDNGPFWIKNDEDRIYRVVIEAEEKRVVYFDFTLFKTYHKWEDE